MGEGTLRRILAVTGLTFREAWRRKVVVAALVMTAGFLLLYGTGLHYAARDLAASEGAEGAQVVWRAVLSAQMVYMGLFPASIIVGLIAVLASAGSISSELDTGVLHGVLSRPMRRWELVVGKFLGVGLMVAAYSTALSAAVIGLAKWQLSAPVFHVPQAVGLLVLEPLVLVAVAVLGSSRLSTMATGVLCVAGYGVAVIGGFIEQVGAMIDNATMMNIGIVSSLVMPVDAIHRKALATLLPAVGLVADQMGPFGGAGRATPSVWMIVYAVAYVLGVLFLAARTFAKRDL